MANVPEVLSWMGRAGATQPDGRTMRSRSSRVPEIAVHSSDALERAW